MCKVFLELGHARKAFKNNICACRTGGAATGFAGLWKAYRSPAKPFEAVRQDRVWAEPNSWVSS